MPMRGNSRFSIENFLSYSTEKFCRGTLPCFTKILVSKSFMDKRGGRECHDFLSKFFCLTVPKTFVGEPFSVSLISGIEIFYAYEGTFTIFYRKSVVSQCRKSSLGNPSVFHYFPISKNFFPMTGMSRFSLKILFSHYRKTS